MTDTKTPSPSVLSSLRHLYQNMVNGGVRDTASAKRIAEGLLAPAIEALERSKQPAPVREPLTQVAILNAYCATPGIHQFIEAFVAGARFAERAHGIAACSGKENSNAD